MRGGLTNEALPRNAGAAFEPAARFRSAVVALVAGLACALALAPMAITPAQAQLLDQLKGAAGGQAGGGLTGGALPSVNQASPSNLAGVLQYCVKNNYLSGGSASSVEHSLLGKAGPSGAHDSGFASGSNGVLQGGGNGQDYTLGGGGIKQQVTQKVCGLVLQHGKSLL